jgi:hypothetical protein
MTIDPDFRHRNWRLVGNCDHVIRRANGSIIIIVDSSINDTVRNGGIIGYDDIGLKRDISQTGGNQK